MDPTIYLTHDTDVMTTNNRCYAYVLYLVTGLPQLRCTSISMIQRCYMQNDLFLNTGNLNGRLVDLMVDLIWTKLIWWLHLYVLKPIPIIPSPQPKPNSYPNTDFHADIWNIDVLEKKGHWNRDGSLYCYQPCMRYKWLCKLVKDPHHDDPIEPMAIWCANKRGKFDNDLIDLSVTASSFCELPKVNLNWVWNNTFLKYTFQVFCW